MLVARRNDIPVATAAPVIPKQGTSRRSKIIFAMLIETVAYIACLVSLCVENIGETGYHIIRGATTNTRIANVMPPVVNSLPKMERISL